MNFFVRMLGEIMLKPLSSCLQDCPVAFCMLNCENKASAEL